jgi:hypothetical protein
MPKFMDDFNKVVNAVTAEQHALDNPGHVVTVQYWEFGIPDAATPAPILALGCSTCEWWDAQQQ